MMFSSSRTGLNMLITCLVACFTVLSFFSSTITTCDAFVVQPRQQTKCFMIPNNNNNNNVNHHAIRRNNNGMIFNKQQRKQITTTTTTSSRLFMGYNLPPSNSGGGGGGGGKNNNDIQSILSGGLTLIGIIAFFVSPLGGIFFAITNSILLLTILTPVILFIVFQLWQTFNTIDGPCPSCGAPAKVMKDPETPSICFNCGTLIKASSDNTAIEFADMNNVVVDTTDESYNTAPTTSIFDSIMSNFEDKSTPSSSSSSSTQDLSSQYRREQTIIDVDVEKDDRK